MGEMLLDQQPIYGSAYLFTNLVNRKRYVGQTISVDPIKYCQRHLTSAAKGHSKYLYNAIRKYGEDNFTFEIIGYAEDKQALDLLEDFYIRILGTLHPNGYNLQGGGARGKPSKITRDKRSISMTAAHKRPETKIKHTAGIQRAANDPIKKARQIASLNDPINKARRVAALKARFSTVESHDRKIAAGREVASRPGFAEKQKDRFLDPIFRDSHQQATKDGMLRIQVQHSEKMKEVYQSEEGRKIQSLRNKGRQWITNGTEDKLLKNGHEVPEGWRFGRINSRANPRYGDEHAKATKDRDWINDGTKSLMLKPGAPLPNGWSYGRVSFRRRRPITNGLQCILLEVDAPLPEGWSYGKLKS